MARCLVCDKEIPTGYHFCGQCGAPLVETERQGKVIVHRAFEGEHETNGESCWCGPTVMEADDMRDVDEICAETERLDG